MGRPKNKVRGDAPAVELARFLQDLRQRAGKTYLEMAGSPGAGGFSATTFSRADTGEVRPRGDVLDAYVRACGGSANDLREARRRWAAVPGPRPGQARPAGRDDGQPRWWHPDLVCEPEQLLELMRAARAACGTPAIRQMERRAGELGIQLFRSTLSDVLRAPQPPSRRVFCDFMRLMAAYSDSPAADFPRAAWESAWDRAQAGRVRRPSQAEPPPASASASARENGSRSGLRRPRLAKRPWAPPGPLRVLKGFLYDLYLQAGAPTMTEIARHIRQDDTLPVAPKRDSINRILSGPQLPTNQTDVVAVATTLAVLAHADPAPAAARARELWIGAAAKDALGQAVSDLRDPIALGVRATFLLSSAPNALPDLPPYVRRAHDGDLADTVQRAVEGHSGIAVARGAWATGKTRACWEAVRTLPTGWRLWYPSNPGDSKEVLEAVSQAGPGTVIWLDRIDRHLESELAHQIGAEILKALHHPDRAPILVIGSIADSAALLAEPDGSAPDRHASARALVREASILVPDAFTAEDLREMRALAGTDPRLALAEANAEQAVTQFLTGNRNAHPMLRTSTFEQATVNHDAVRLHLGAALLQEKGRTQEAATWYQRAAEAGDVQALHAAAELVSETRTPEEAILWLRDRAVAGDSAAAAEAARRLNKEGLAEEAIVLYQQAAEQEESGRALTIAASLLRHHGRSAEAVDWLYKRARAGDRTALREAAHLLWNEGDHVLALAQYRRAAELGDTAALREAGEKLRATGRLEEAIHWYRQAVLAGDDTPLRVIADLLQRLGRTEEALDWYIRAAEKGDAVAMRLAASILRLSGDTRAALAWYLLSAEKGDLSSLHHIGVIHQRSGDIDTALDWYGRAADRYDADSMREAGWMLWEAGRLEEALDWLRRRTKSGHLTPIREFAHLLREVGREAESLEWYDRAADLGDRNARRHADRLRTKAVRSRPSTDRERPHGG